MKVLITGAYGYIGSHLCNALDADNDILRIGTESGVDLSQKGWTDLLPDEPFDVVYHMAQSLRYREFPEGAADMLAVNVDATAELLDWSRRHQVKRFIFTSTGNVYKNTNMPLDEEAETSPESFYAATKLSAEYLAKQYKSHMDVVILRLFGVYGPGQRNMLIPSIIDKIKNDAPVTLAQGEGIWLTPTYIDDAIYFLKNVINQELNSNFEVFNLAGTEKVNLGQITEIISRLLKRKSIINPTNDAPAYFVADNSKLLKMYRQYVFSSIEEGLRKTINIHE